jgi:hypothetical protein
MRHDRYGLYESYDPVPCPVVFTFAVVVWEPIGTSETLALVTDDLIRFASLFLPAREHSNQISTKSNASPRWTMRPVDGEGKCAVQNKVGVPQC